MGFGGRLHCHSLGAHDRTCSAVRLECTAERCVLTADDVSRNVDGGASSRAASDRCLGGDSLSPRELSSNVHRVWLGLLPDLSSTRAPRCCSKRCMYSLTHIFDTMK
ncbi:unnamed protein product [Strongylus vulgaris]|uniref:Uncharacterized protein n=1 Tax=Strongylus vulgaris TaxID=40348 RepID=A0A3P7KD50_STRVU|nr:unnamed protein product [Strongylus vulgaris]